ncbi:hypothetical protein KUTeg_000182 [Tegillarca granosa]|uniref:Uncharacterized protein n=1 Tax=Tegillarca granosa TaxID=220873 RepID=A0ABQ9FWU2_TEGGR|nr:hypothetical protein KUTeg_000182 [Tegillarca granosa]
MNNLKLTMKVQVICVVLLLMVVCEVTFAAHYSPQELGWAVKSICCINGRKREVTHEIGKETASNFLSKLGRDKRGLRAHCCSLDSSTCNQAAISSILYEECVHEGCSVEEIDESC